jgi:hypothetical protein
VQGTMPVSKAEGAAAAKTARRTAEKSVRASITERDELCEKQGALETNTVVHLLIYGAAGPDEVPPRGHVCTNI